MSYVFECLSCGATTDPAERPAGCPECGGRLEVVLDFETFPDALPGAESDADAGSDTDESSTDAGSDTDESSTDAGSGTDPKRTDLWRYADFLPTDSLDCSSEEPPTTSMGEGWTPIVDLSNLSAVVGAGSADGPEILLKNETTNPTWSWKDRLAVLVVPHAVAAGTERIATASTGNHASAIAAYASRAGVENVLAFVSPASEAPHLRQIRAYGAEAIQLTDYGERKRLLRELAERGWFVAYDLANYATGQPYVYEGYKTIAFEIVEQLGEVPDAVVVPVGAGDGLYGIWKGFRELAAHGITATKPRMISAESAERHPVAEAVEAGAESVGRDDGPEPLSTSTMGATSGDHALAAVLASNGGAYAADRETVASAIRVCGRDGVFLEPASALAPAVVSKAVADGVVGPDDTVVAVGTGAGIAWPEKTAEAVGEAPTVEPDLDAISEIVALE